MKEPVASIDFETRSTIDIKLGLDHYTSCPEFEVLVLSGRLPGLDVGHWHRGHDCAQPVTGADWLAALHEYVRRGGKVRGWNIMFEWMVWNKVAVPKYGWPELPIEQCVDTMAQAAAHNLPQALDKCGEALGLDPEKLKSKRGKYLIQRLCVPHKPTKDRPGVWVQDPELFAELVQYCDQDVIAEESIAKKLRPLTEWQQRVWLLTQRINRAGVPVHLGECEAIESVVEAEKQRLNGELARITRGAVPAASNRDKLLAWVNANIAPQAAPVGFVDPVDEDDGRPGHGDDELDDLRGKTVEDALKRDDLPPAVRRALEIRAAVVQTSTAKFTKMRKVAVRHDGWGFIRGMFTYHGAGTGRWASRGGVNVQNFTRPSLVQDLKTGIDEIEAAHQVLGRGDHAGALALWGDSTMDAAVSCLRGVIHAPPGHDFIDADFSSVENRVGVWLAGQEDKVELFRKGLDEYKVFASKALYRVPYDAVTKDMRQMSKSAVLGCLFGQGWRGLITYALQYDVVLEPEHSQEIVKSYRREYEKVRNLWYACGDASIDAVRNPGTWFSAGDKLELICHKNFLWMRLPSGRYLAWSRPKIETREAPWMEKFFVGYDEETGEEMYEDRQAMRDVVTVESIETRTRKYVRHPLIGSSIFQSAVQGTAADILAEGTLEVEAAGYTPVLLAHDECLSIVPEGWGDEDEYGRLLCTAAPWREDLPLAYEAYRAKRFRK